MTKAKSKPHGGLDDESVDSGNDSANDDANNDQSVQSSNVQ